MIHGKRSKHTSRKLVTGQREEEVPIPRPEPVFDAPGGNAGGGEFDGTVEEVQIAWDADGGHNHDGTVTRAITITGDASGTNLANTVSKLHNLTIATPAAGDDGQFLRYNHATGYSWEAAGASTITVQEGDTTVDAAATTLDFAAADFNVTSSPAGEANIAWQGFTVEEGNVSVATDIKDLDFGAGFDVTAAGGEAEISLDLSEIVTGDVSFSTNAATVNKIKGYAVDAPLVGDDGQFLRYNHTGTTYSWEQVAFSGLSGSLSATQHGTLAVGSGADHTGDLAATAKVNVYKGGVLIGTQRSIDFIEGTNITLTVTDAGGEINVTIDAAAGGAGTIVVQEGDATVDAAAGTLDFSATDFNVTSSPAGEANISWQGFTVKEATVSVATDIKTLDFGAGFDVSAAAGEADVTLDLSEIVTGDVTYTTNAAKVTGIQGIAVNGAPVALDTGKALFYLHSATQWSYAQLAYPVTLWRRGDIGLAGTSYSELPGNEGYNTGFVMPYDGYVVAISASLSGDVGGAGLEYYVALYVAPTDADAYAVTATLREAVITGAVGTQKTARTRDFMEPVVAGSRLTVYDKRVGALAAVAGRATIWILPSD